MTVSIRLRRLMCKVSLFRRHLRHLKQRMDQGWSRMDSWCPAAFLPQVAGEMLDFYLDQRLELVWPEPYESYEEWAMTARQVAIDLRYFAKNHGDSGTPTDPNGTIKTNGMEAWRLFGSWMTTIWW